MQKSKRLSIIRQYLLIHKDVKIEDLLDLIKVSESTIRRDVKFLSNEGFLKEFYGSLVLVEKDNENLELYDRLSLNFEAKNIIGKKAANLIKNDSTVYLDSGSTTFHAIKHIKAKNVIFTTNGINIAIELARLGYHVQIIAGTLKMVNLTIVGESAVNSIANYSFDIAFLGANAYDDEGYSTPDYREGIIKQNIIKHSKKAYVLIDRSKYKKKNTYQFAKTKECELISDLKGDK
jgi:DeoR family fructose operon transcriptional repressor